MVAFLWLGAQTAAADTDADARPQVDAASASAPAGFVTIAAGTFLMGSPEGELGRGVDEVQHEVTLTRAYHLAIHPVTEAQWAAVMGGRSESPLPKVNVTWFQAVEYCNRLSRREGLAPAYVGSGTNWRWDRDADGYRLPTEAEWEHACRAGSETAFAAGPITETSCLDALLMTIGWFCGNSDGKRQPVALKTANPWGLHDMNGNVWEWCWDRWADLAAVPVTDPTGPEFGSHRVTRGGSFFDGAGNCRCARRGGFVLPSTRSEEIGFRVARWADLKN